MPLPPSCPEEHPLFSNLSLRSRTLVLLGLAVLPMVGLLAHTVWSEYELRVAQAERGVLSLAEAHAAHLERTLQDVAALLDELVRSTQWQGAGEAACHAYLRSFRNAVPTVGEVSGFGPGAEILCTSGGILGDQRAEPAPERSAFVQSVMESRGTLYGVPASGRLTDRVGVTVGMPIPGAAPDAPPRGAAAAKIELGRLQEVLAPRSLPLGTVVTVARAHDGLVVARSENWEEWVGQSILWGNLEQAGLLEGPGLNRTLGADGVDRLWGFAPIHGPAWVVFVGVPEEEIYGPIRASVMRNGGAVATLIFLVAILAGVFHRSLRAAVRGFTVDAKGAADDPSRRIALRGVKELDLLAHEFNRTLEARTEAEEQLVRAEQDLQGARRMEVVGDMAAGIAHEFNNLLTVIRMENALVQEDLTRAGLRVHGPVQVERASGRAADLVHQLLALGRRDPSSPEWLCPSAELEFRLPRYRGEFGDRLNIHLDVNSSCPRVYIDPRHLDQIVRNLIHNAWDAMPEGGTVTIEVSRGAGVPQPVTPGRSGPSEVDGPSGVERGESPTCLIRVSDTGPGMTQDVRRRAFDPFFTTRPHGQRVGLGLSTVYGIATRSGAQVNLESRPGAGTTVEVILPGTDDPPSASVPAAEGGPSQ